MEQKQNPVFNFSIQSEQVLEMFNGLKPLAEISIQRAEKNGPVSIGEYMEKRGDMYAFIDLIVQDLEKVFESKFNESSDKQLVKKECINSITLCVKNNQKDLNDPFVKNKEHIPYFISSLEELKETIEQKEIKTVEIKTEETETEETKTIKTKLSYLGCVLLQHLLYKYGEIKTAEITKTNAKNICELRGLASADELLKKEAEYEGTDYMPLPSPEKGKVHHHTAMQFNKQLNIILPILQKESKSAFEEAQKRINKLIL